MYLQLGNFCNGVESLIRQPPVPSVSLLPPFFLAKFRMRCDGFAGLSSTGAGAEYSLDLDDVVIAHERQIMMER